MAKNYEKRDSVSQEREVAGYFVQEVALLAIEAPDPPVSNKVLSKQEHLAKVAYIKTFLSVRYPLAFVERILDWYVYKVADSTRWTVDWELIYHSSYYDQLEAKAQKFVRTHPFPVRVASNDIELVIPEPGCIIPAEIGRLDGSCSLSVLFPNLVIEEEKHPRLFERIKGKLFPEIERYFFIKRVEPWTIEALYTGALLELQGDSSQWDTLLVDFMERQIMSPPKAIDKHEWLYQPGESRMTFTVETCPGAVAGQPLVVPTEGWFSPVGPQVSLLDLGEPDPMGRRDRRNEGYVSVFPGVSLENSTYVRWYQELTDRPFHNSKKLCLVHEPAWPGEWDPEVRAVFAWAQRRGEEVYFPLIDLKSEFPRTPALAKALAVEVMSQLSVRIPSTYAKGLVVFQIPLGVMQGFQARLKLLSRQYPDFYVGYCAGRGSTKRWALAHLQVTRGVAEFKIRTRSTAKDMEKKLLLTLKGDLDPAEEACLEGVRLDTLDLTGLFPWTLAPKRSPVAVVLQLIVQIYRLFNCISYCPFDYSPLLDFWYKRGDRGPNLDGQIIVTDVLGVFVKDPF